MQIVNVSEEEAFCKSCGSNLVELGNFEYCGSTLNSSREKDEQCKCKKCGALFTLHYDLFNPDGHIQSFVFSGDVNDPAFNWQDILTDEQKQEIGTHLKSCKTCSDRLTEAIISDAWLASLLHNGKKNGPT